MVLLADYLPGSIETNYAKLFGDLDIGMLISAIQGTIIALGDSLEKIIPEIAITIDDDMVDAFMKKTLPPGIYVIPKSVMRKSKYFMFDEQPDLLLVNVDKNTCKVMEIKLGKNFDTKKVDGELASLKSYAETLERGTTYRISIGFCAWYAKDKKAIVKGFKGKITEKEAFTGKDFCEMAHINFEDVEKAIISHEEENRKVFFKRVFEIYKKYNYSDI